MKRNTLNWNFFLTGIMFFGILAACNSQSGKEEQDNFPPVEEVVDPGTPPHPGDEVIERRNLDGINELIQEYMDVKNALVHDNYEQAKQAASNMQNSLEDSEISQEQRNELMGPVRQMAEAQDIKAQRQAFDQLSRQLYQLVQNNEVSGKTLYWQHCPMALGSQGANWLSYEEHVRNPYMGQRMPGCGSVEETINQ